MNVSLPSALRHASTRILFIVVPLLSGALSACAPKLVADEASLKGALKPEEMCVKPSYRVSIADLPDQRMVRDEPDPALPDYRRLEELGLVTIAPGKISTFDILNIALTPLGEAQIGGSKAFGRVCGVFMPQTLSDIEQKDDEAVARATGPLEYQGWASRPDYRQALLDEPLPTTAARTYAFKHGADGWVLRRGRPD